jgi:hypothetical protein
LVDNAAERTDAIGGLPAFAAANVLQADTMDGVDASHRLERVPIYTARLD